MCTVCPSNWIIHSLWDSMFHYCRCCWYSPSHFLTELLWPEGCIDLVYTAHTLLIHWSCSYMVWVSVPFAQAEALFLLCLPFSEMLRVHFPLLGCLVLLATAVFPWVLCETVLHSSPIWVTSPLLLFRARYSVHSRQKTPISFDVQTIYMTLKYKMWQLFSTIKKVWCCRKDTSLMCVRACLVPAVAAAEGPSALSGLDRAVA